MPTWKLWTKNGVLLTKNGALLRCDDCPCKPLLGDILMWGGSSALVDLYEGMGRTVHGPGDWSGNLDDYSLIIWLNSQFVFPSGDPPWWPQIVSGDWTGRIHMSTENNAFFSPTYLNAKLVEAGCSISAIGAAIDCAIEPLPASGTIEGHALTSGMSAFKYNCTSRVTGGTTISKTEFSDQPWIAQEKVGTIDFVVAGDTNHGTGTPITSGTNVPFWENLYLDP